MTQSDTLPLCEVSIHIDAPADTVWDLISDLPRMGEWSPETRRVEWQGGAVGPTVGTKFKGHNAAGAKKWTTTGTIAECERGRVVSWDVTAYGLPVSRWRYQITPSGDAGCDVTEQMFDHRWAPTKWAGGLVSGSDHGAAHNSKGMEETLQRLKAAAEAQSRGAAG